MPKSDQAWSEGRSEDDTLALRGLLWRRFEGCHDCLSGKSVSPCLVANEDNQDGKSNLIKDVFELILSQSATLNVFDCTQFLGHSLAIFFLHRCHSLFCKLFFDSSLIAQIGLSTNDQAWDAGAVVVDFWEPFLAHIFEGSR